MARLDRRREEGMALFLTVLMLVFMTAIALAALEVVSTDGRIAGLQNRARNAFYAGEAGAAAARAAIRNVASRTVKPAFFTSGSPKLLGDAGLYDRESRQPRFYGDPSIAEPIRYIGESEGQILEGFNLSVQGQKLSSTLWQANVVGESADGSKVRIEVTEVKVMAVGY